MFSTFLIRIASNLTAERQTHVSSYIIRLIHLACQHKWENVFCKVVSVDITIRSSGHHIFYASDCVQVPLMPQRPVLQSCTAVAVWVAVAIGAAMAMMEVQQSEGPPLIVGESSDANYGGQYAWQWHYA